MPPRRNYLSQPASHRTMHAPTSVNEPLGLCSVCGFRKQSCAGEPSVSVWNRDDACQLAFNRTAANVLAKETWPCMRHSDGVGRWMQRLLRSPADPLRLHADPRFSGKSHNHSWWMLLLSAPRSMQPEIASCWADATTFLCVSTLSRRSRRTGSIGTVRGLAVARHDDEHGGRPAWVLSRGLYSGLGPEAELVLIQSVIPADTSRASIHRALA